MRSPSFAPTSRRSSPWTCRRWPPPARGASVVFRGDEPLIVKTTAAWPCTFIAPLTRPGTSTVKSIHVRPRVALKVKDAGLGMAGPPSIPPPVYDAPRLP